jgi:hypothetical protein
VQPRIDGPRVDLDEDQVDASLAWGHSTRVRWGVDLLNSQLEPTGLTVEFTQGSVAWQWRAQPVSGQSPVEAQIRRTGSLTYRHRDEFTPLSVLYRPWVEMQAPPDEDAVWVRWHLGVFTAIIPPWTYEGRFDRLGPVVWRTLDLADRSHFWQTDQTVDPIVVMAGTDLVQWVKDDLAIRFNEPDTSLVVIDSPAKTATQDYTFDSGTPWLQVYNTLLGAVGNEPLHTTAEGLAASAQLSDPTLRVPEHDYGFGTTVLPAATVSAVNPDLPNTVRFVARRAPTDELPEEGVWIRTMVNQNNGPASIDQRGGRVVALRVDVDAQSQEELEVQAAALAPFYLAGGGLRYSGQVGLNPRHDDSDVVSMDKPALEITGNWLVTSWSIQLGPVDQMRVMSLEMEQLTGSAFVVVPDPPLGAYGTNMYGTFEYGGPI